MTQSSTKLHEGLLSPPTWKILVVDDEEDVHVLTKLECKSYSFQDKPVEIISTYSAEEAKEELAQQPDIAVLLLDVVMETNDAGLKLVEYIRHELNNHLIRIVIRTGQPGYAPEKDVTNDYDINDYREKSELTTLKFYTVLTSALRGYHDLLKVELQQQAIQQLLNSFDRFVPHEFLNHLNKKKIIEIQPGDFVEKKMNILFCDIGAYHSLSAAITPKKNFELLNKWLHLIGPIIRQCGGFVDKYQGDGVLALFPGDPKPCIDCAIAIHRAREQFAEKLQSLDFSFIIGIGINTGPLIMGTVGDENRIDCTVLSDAVDLTYRLKQLTRTYSNGIIINQSTYECLAVKDSYMMRKVGKIQMKGKHKTSEIYEIMDCYPVDIVDKQFATLAKFEQGVNLYQQGKLSQALDYFQSVFDNNAQDIITKIYLDRIRYYEQVGLPEEWLGVLDDFQQ